MTKNNNSPKKLNQTILKKENKNKFKQKTIEVQGYTVKLDEEFAETKIDRMLKDLSDKLVKSDEDGCGLLDHFSIYDLLAYYVIKHFTDFGKGIKGDYKKDLEVFEMLVNTGFFQPIAESFTEDQYSQVSERMVEVVNQFNKQNKEIEKTGKELRDEVRNLNLDNEDIIFGDVSEERKNEKSKLFDPSLIKKSDDK